MNDIINNFIKDNWEELELIAKKVIKSKASKDWEDLFQESLEALYKIKKEKLLILINNNCLKYYLIKIYKNQVYTFYKNKVWFYDPWYDQPDIYGADTYGEDLEEELLDDRLYKKTMKILQNNVEWFDREVFIRYHHRYLSFSKFAEETNIPKSSLYAAYQRALTIIKKELKNDGDYIFKSTRK